MLRSLAISLCSIALVGCGTSELDARRELSTQYSLEFQKGESILRAPNVRGSTLALSSDDTFKQECLEASGRIVTLNGTWQTDGEWVTFDKFLDCVGAWPPTATPGRAHLHYRLRPATIIVEPDLGVAYVAGQ